MFGRLRVVIILIAAFWAISGSVLAHANLYQSAPRFNEELDEAPGEIRLWFTEPIEPEFSHIYILDASGSRLEMPDAQVDLSAPTQLIMRPAVRLPDGLYTVSWRVVSAADAHPTAGSYTFTIGMALADAAIMVLQSESIPAQGSLIRWLNLLSLALLTGSMGFRLFVWNPAAPESIPAVEHRLAQLAWAGWMAAGAAGLLLLFNQLAVVIDAPLFAGVNADVLMRLIRDTRFGHLWLIRMGLWLWLATGLGLASGNNLRMYWLCLLTAGGMLAMNSLVSHAASAYDAPAAMFNDMLHLLATSLWVGGLMAFLAVLPVARRMTHETTGLTGRLVAHFSNFARVAVTALILTGFYAAWLQVGSLEGLLTTLYGQALLVKLVLILPVLALAGINLLVTQRGLNSGKPVWNRRLTMLVGAEVVVTVMVLAAVGAMTSVSPARNTLSLRSSLPGQSAANPFHETKTADDLTMDLSIEPGWVGENTFTLALHDAAGNPVEDAARIRMRFENQSSYLGESELRLEHTGSGLYTAVGTNLASPGDWRLRFTITRPNQFDAVVDFTPHVEQRPTPALPVPLPDNSAVLPERLAVLIAAGILMLAAGGYFLVENRRNLFSLSGLIAAVLVLLAGLFFISVLIPVPASRQPAPVINRDLIVRNEWMIRDFTDSAGVFMMIDNGTSQAERLIRVTSDATAKAEIYGAALVEGVSEMMPEQFIDVPANQQVYLAPGTWHIMLFGIRRDIQAGNTITLTLEFASGKQVTAEVKVTR